MTTLEYVFRDILNSVGRLQKPAFWTVSPATFQAMMRDLEIWCDRSGYLLRVDEQGSPLVGGVPIRVETVLL